MELRVALRETLTSLGNELLLDSEQQLSQQLARVERAELGAMRGLLAVALRALTGAELPGDEHFPCASSVHDAHDSAALMARELKQLRQTAEAALTALPLQVQPVVQELLQLEALDTSRVDELERARAARLQQGGEQCASAVCELVCATLQAQDCHARAPNAALRASALVSDWLSWRSGALTCEAVPVREMTSALSVLTLQDMAAAEYVRVLRRCMRLRRQQARLVCMLQRLAAATRVADTAELLQGKIVFP